MHALQEAESRLVRDGVVSQCETLEAAVLPDSCTHLLRPVNL